MDVLHYRLRLCASTIRIARCLCGSRASCFSIHCCRVFVIAWRASWTGTSRVRRITCPKTATSRCQVTVVICGMWVSRLSVVF